MLTCNSLAEKIHNFAIREGEDGWEVAITSIHVTVEDRYAILSDPASTFYFQYIWETPPKMKFMNHSFIFEPHAEKSYILFESTRVSGYNFNQVFDVKEMVKWGKHKINLEDL